MKYRPCFLLLLSVALAGAQAAAPSIRDTDMFNQAGLYYRAYVNSYDPFNPTTSVPASGLIGTTGDFQQLWDFSEGPSEEIFRFDYLVPNGIPEAADFPDATLVEKMTAEVGGRNSYLFLEAVPGVGRRVYGFYDEEFSATTPASPFNPPIIDFPTHITYGDQWTTSTTILTTIGLLDPELSLVIPAQVVFSSEFQADAWGVVLLPELGPVQTLRVNEVQTISISVDLDGEGQYMQLETDYTRNYYWLSPGRGIVAQMNSVQATSPPPANFAQAATFTRMFETNKDPTSVGESPEPVADLQVIPGDGLLVLKWSRTPNTSRYQVEYSTGGFGPTDWAPLGAPTSTTSVLDSDGMTDQIRFYRVISLP